MVFENLGNIPNIKPTEIIFQLTLWAGLLIWLLIIVGGALFFVYWRKYNIPVTIYEIIGNGIVQTKITRAKEVIKDGVSKYVLRSVRGLFFKKYREYYLNQSPVFKLLTKRGYKFNLLRLGFNAYNPIKMNVYSNTLDKVLQIFKETITKKAELNPKKQQKEIIKDNTDYYYNYIPINIQEAPVDMEIIPQNLLPHLSRSIIETNEMYREKKWWELYLPHLFIATIAIFSIIQLVILGWSFQKAGEISGTCMKAEKGIIDTLKQKIT